MSDIPHNNGYFPARLNIPAMRADHDIDIDIRGILLMFWRRKMVVISALLIGLSLATIAVGLTTPRYMARSLLLVESNDAGAAEQFQTLMRTMSLDSTLVLNELEVLRSRTLARQVVQRLNLMNDPEFNKRFEDTSTGQDNSFRKLSIYNSELESLPLEVVDRDIAKVVEEFLDHLYVRSIPGSMALQVEFSSRDPAKAALIANGLVDTYIEQKLDEKFQATQKLTGWLDKRLADLRGQVREAEQAVADYKAAYNLVEGSRTALSAEELSELNSQLVLAKAQKAEAEAKLTQIQKLADNPGQIDTASDIIESELIRALKFEELRIESEISELASRYGEKHPEMRKRRAELRELRATIHDEMLKISESVEMELGYAEARVSALQNGLGEVTGQRNIDNEAMIKLRELEREAASSQLIFDTFLETYKRSDAQEDLQEPEARVISYAIVPTEASWPNSLLIFALSGVFSLFAGLAAAVFLEKLDNTYRSAAQLEGALGYPCYALIPTRTDMEQPDLANYIISKPTSTIAESVRSLRMAMNLRSGRNGDGPRVVSVTSSLPGEGKTTLSLWLGRQAAKSGEKVIVIDADLRRPNVHKAAGKSSDATLVEYLTGRKELDAIVQKDEGSGLHIICGRSVPNNALDLLGSVKMRKLVESLRKVYDLVIIDCPACLAVSDARLMTTFSDQTLYAVGWDATPREVVISGVKQFADMGYGPLAFVLTNVDVDKHVRYGYGDAAHYYGRYKEYYAD